MKININQYKAVIFDMDGLLIDSESLSLKAWFKTADKLSFTFTEEIFLSYLGYKVSDVKQKFTEVFKDEISFDEAWNVKEAIRKEMIEAEGMPLMIGAEEIISFFDNKEIPKIIATSSSRERALNSLEFSGLLSKFPDFVAGDEVVNGKPAPDIYLKAAARLNVNPQDCIVFEDAEAGVQAGSAAKMDVVLIPGLKSPTKEIKSLAKYVFEDLKSFLELCE
ncbi:MAG: HAD family phosphatase [Bdellovibrionales bacterium]|nr:HAD family phosphatase [Bdellovibrionales bacterium]